MKTKKSLYRFFNKKKIKMIENHSKYIMIYTKY